ncbi:MAG: PQQ-dependent sugar dehydrogenase [Ilumatobacteraceae bacterium]
MTRRRCPTAVLIMAVAVVAAGCADDDSTGPATTTPATTTPGDTTPATATAGDTAPATTSPSPMGDPEVTFTEVVRLDRPIGLATRPDDPTLYVVEQPGRVTAVDDDGDRTRTVLDVTARTSAQGERGLLGLTFSPDGSHAYTNHTDRDSGATVVSEFEVEPDGTFVRDSGRVLLEIAQPFGNHNGGHLVTGPDDLLYIGMGDGGSGGDPERVALDPSSPLGSILRIDPTPTADAPYSIPDDNPFLDVDGAVPATFAIGLRNPWKFTFDPLTADLWVADVGQNEIEEINMVPAPDDGIAGAGLSFGWSAFEGDRRFNTDLDPDGHVDPVLTYDHDEGECSISGGAPYRGSAVPELTSGYVYGDFCSGRVWALDLDGGRNLLLGELDGTVAAVLPGPDRELYVLSQDGPVWRIDPAAEG